MTYKRAFEFLFGNPMRDIELTKQAISKINTTKSASALAKRLAQQFSNDIYLEESRTIQEWNHRMLEIEQY